MNFMFYGSEFNNSISNWDVSNVIDMQFMFASSKFNGDISNWDVRNVKNILNIFSGCKEDVLIAIPYWATYKNNIERKCAIDNYLDKKALTKELESSLENSTHKKRIKI